MPLLPRLSVFTTCVYVSLKAVPLYPQCFITLREVVRAVCQLVLIGPRGYKGELLSILSTRQALLFVWLHGGDLKSCLNSLNGWSNHLISDGRTKLFYISYTILDQVYDRTYRIHVDMFVMCVFACNMCRHLDVGYCLFCVCLYTVCAGVWM